MTVRESDVALAIAGIWSSVLKLNTFNEVPVIIHGQEVVLDLVGKGWRGSHVRILVCEAKVRLTWQHFEQGIRIMPHADQVWLAVSEPKAQSRRHKLIRAKIEQMGLGLYYVQIQTQPYVSTEIKAMEISRNQQWQIVADSLADPQKAQEPGVPSPKRIRPDRFDDARAFLKELEGRIQAKELQVELGWRRDKAREFIKLVRDGQMPQITGDNSAPMLVWWDEKA